MRNSLKKTVDALIDEELSLHDEFKDCVGHIHLTFLSIKQERLLREEYVDNETKIRYDLADDEVDSSGYDDSDSDDDRLPADNKGAPNNHSSPNAGKEEGIHLQKEDADNSDKNEVNNKSSDNKKNELNKGGG